MGFRKIILLSFTAMAICGFSACGNMVNTSAVTKIALSANGVTVEGAAIPSDSDAPVYLSHDVIYYEDKETYQSGNPYGNGDDDEKHPAAEAKAVSVVNITEPGTYRVFGTLEEGQIRVDLGEKAYRNKNAVVSLLLDNAHISCSLAPAILFKNVYECDSKLNSANATANVDTSAAGANILLADGSRNTLNGSHVAEIWKDQNVEETLWKQDGAVSSEMSLNIGGEEQGTGTLSITADNEGIAAQRHLTVNSGNVNIFAGSDGINTGKAGVSVAAVNGGNLRIAAGLSGEGNGIDSEGWLVVNGGSVVACGDPRSDAGLTSAEGSYINGGTVMALGSSGDWAAAESSQATMNLRFGEVKNPGEAVVVTDTEDNAVFAYDPAADEILSPYAREYTGAVISCGNFALDSAYRVYFGGTVHGAEIEGLYDTATVSALSGGVEQSFLEAAADGGVLQGKSGSSVHDENDVSLREDDGEPASETADIGDIGKRLFDFYLKNDVSCFSEVMSE